MGGEWILWERERRGREREKEKIRRGAAKEFVRN